MEASQDQLRSRTRWISKGFEALICELASRERAAEVDFDVLIVGSGYGGAIAAAELSKLATAGTQLRIAILERGNEYLPGMFPAHESELPGHVRFSTAADPRPRGNRGALFDVRVGADVCAVVANGLGGGSLINAGILLEPEEFALAKWPRAIRSMAAMQPFYEEARKLLGGTIAPSKVKTIADHVRGVTPSKYLRLGNLGGEHFDPAPLSVSMQNGPNQAKVGLNACTLCGNCMTGCNFGAKNSLDENLLAQAFRNGVSLYTGATVLDLGRAPHGAGWIVRAVHTDPDLRAREQGATEIRARRVILAAGTFGSPEILLRSRERNQLALSNDNLGKGFSGNGDLLTAAYKLNADVNGLAADGWVPLNATVGPTITGMIDLRTGNQRGMVIQEFAIPAPMRRVFKETCALAHSLSDLAQYDDSTHRPQDTNDPHCIDHDAMQRTLLLGVMGYDESNGRLQLNGTPSDDVDGMTTVVWEALHKRESKVFERQVEKVGELLADSGLGGELLQNPLWRLLPDSLSSIFEMDNGPALTVHPLGGCRMAEDASGGVVDDMGRVFDPQPGASGSKHVHDGLVVLDGSIIPSSLGVNPALTIAAVSLRAVTELRRVWQLEASSEIPNRALTAARPVFRVPTKPANDDQPTQVTILERMTGKAQFADPQGRPLACVIELTLQFAASDLQALMGPMPRKLHIDPDRSMLRIFDEARWEELVELGEPEHTRDRAALFVAPLSGDLTLLSRGASDGKSRQKRAKKAWWRNRGKRDALQGLSARSVLSILALRKARAALASHAGEERFFEYSLQIGSPRQPECISIAAKSILGRKRLTYDLYCNPWKQLMEMQLTEFRGLQAPLPKLDLDLRFLAVQGVPLLQIVQQRDHATALFDMVSFVLYLTRLLISIHLWSFRKPDRAWEPPFHTKAGAVPGINRVADVLLPVGTGSDEIRLVRYQGESAVLGPVLLIHGYSANALTFAHPQIQPNLASYLCDQRRDVWVVDLRTSSAFENAAQPWSFETVALTDIPTALRHIESVVRQEKPDVPVKIDVVAHCMGAAMLSMCILGTPDPGIRALLGNIVLSQIGPVMVFTPANVFRGFAMGYLKQLFRFDKVDFQPEGSAKFADELLDRLLSTLPYPDGEFEIENPEQLTKEARYSRTRHRMDAWFGRVFQLANMEEHVLRHIDDLFGAVNLKMLLQTLHFARHKMVTDEAGHNFGVTRQQLRARWTMPTLSIHGMENGLADVATVRRLDKVMKDAHGSGPGAPVYKVCRLPGFGHQDCLIGRERRNVFEEIASFLDSPKTYQPTHGLGWNEPVVRSAEDPPPSKQRSIANVSSALLNGASPWQLQPLLAEPPWLGPLVRRETVSNAPMSVCVGANPQLGAPEYIVFAPVEISNGRYQLVGTITNTLFMRWVASQVGANPIYPMPPAPAVAKGFLVLLVYDQHEVLGKSPFADAAADPIDRERVLNASVDAAVRRFVDENPFEIATRAYVDVVSHLPPFDNALHLAAAAPSAVRFAVGSCQYPAGALDSELAWSSYRHLNRLLDAPRPEERPKFLVLTGDQVYVDATAGLFDPTTQDDRYGLPYTKLLRAEPMQAVFRRIGVYSMLDDHEIDDNWAPIAMHTAGHQALMENGRRAYLDFRSAYGPPPLPPVGNAACPLWYPIELHGLQFFFADTRTERELRNASNVHQAHLMSGAQLQALLDWLEQQKDNHDPKFIVSPSVLLPRRVETLFSSCAALHSDAWDGYPRTLHAVLAKIADLQLRNVIFLSGDEHRSCVATIRLRATDPAADVVLHSIHCSPLYAPLPFANGLEQSLAAFDQFDFASPSGNSRGYSCEATTGFAPPGDGFALIECGKNLVGKWQVLLQFSRAGQLTNSQQII